MTTKPQTQLITMIVNYINVLLFVVHSIHIDAQLNEWPSLEIWKNVFGDYEN